MYTRSVDEVRSISRRSEVRLVPLVVPVPGDGGALDVNWSGFSRTLWISTFRAPTGDGLAGSTKMPTGSGVEPSMKTSLLDWRIGDLRGCPTASPPLG